MSASKPQLGISQQFKLPGVSVCIQGGVIVDPAAVPADENTFRNILVSRRTSTALVQTPS